MATKKKTPTLMDRVRNHAGKVLLTASAAGLLAGAIAYENIIEPIYNSIVTPQKTYSSEELKMEMGFDYESSKKMFDRVIFAHERLGEQANKADIGGIAIACDRNGDGVLTAEELRPWLADAHRNLGEKYGAPEKKEYKGSETK